MADAILNQSACPAPPQDTVLLWLTNTIERDYCARSVFPELRLQTAHSVRSSASLHLLTPAQAARLLSDAKVRELEVHKGLKVSYSAHVKGCDAAIQQAEERRTAFTAGDAHCSLKCDSYERWWGTKAQLAAKGVSLDGPWPNEPNGKRWAKAKDWRGYSTSITPYSPLWPGLFEARIEIPIEVWGKKYDKKPAVDEVERARRDLASMPESADDFRAHMVDSMRMMANITLEQAMKPARWHGYTLDEDAVGEIHASFDAVVEAVVGARINFDRARHAETAQQYRAKIAGADAAFQAQFDSLVKPNPSILEGGAQ